MIVRVFTGMGSSRLGSPILIDALQKHLDAQTVGITEDEILRSDRWDKEASLIVFAGMSVTKFKAALGSKGLSKIYNAVAAGTIDYTGICAGASLAASEIYYRVRETPSAHAKWISNQGLSFFNGIACGPIKKITPLAFYGGPEELSLIDIRHAATGQSRKAFYWGGPALLPFENGSGFTTLTTLLGTTLPMSLNGTFGHGRVTLCAYHPEMSSENIARWADVPHGDLSGRLRIRDMAAQADQDTFRHFLIDAGLKDRLKPKKDARHAGAFEYSSP